MIHFAIGYFKEKNAEKYLILDLTEKYDEVFSGIRKEIETINGRKIKKKTMKKTMLEFE